MYKENVCNVLDMFYIVKYFEYYAGESAWKAMCVAEAVFTLIK